MTIETVAKQIWNWTIFIFNKIEVDNDLRSPNPVYHELLHLLCQLTPLLDHMMISQYILDISF